MSLIEKALKKAFKERENGDKSVINISPKKHTDLPDWRDPEDLSNFDKHLVALLEADSVAAEQYRILRTHILTSSKTENKKVFHISSAIRGEGKTLTAINLAISLVRGLQETVLFQSL